MRSRATQTGAQDQIVLTPLAQFLERMEVDSSGFWLPEASGRGVVWAGGVLFGGVVGDNS